MRHTKKQPMIGGRQIAEAVLLGRWMNVKETNAKLGAWLRNRGLSLAKKRRVKCS